MKGFIRARGLFLLLILLALLGLFAYAAFRAGPLAPVTVTVEPVTRAALQPGLYGIGIIDAERRYRIGPIQPGRVARLSVDVGDRVHQGQLLAAMDPVDLEARIAAQQATLASARANREQAQAQLHYARRQLQRFTELLQSGTTSRDVVDGKALAVQSAEAALRAAEERIRQLEHEGRGLDEQLRSLQLLAPADGLVVARLARQGDSVGAGQPLLEIIDPDSLWVSTRIDQVRAQGLKTGLPARIHLRSRPRQPLEGVVARVEPLADDITEEMIVQVRFQPQPVPMPPLGELAEVYLQLPPLPEGPVIPNAALHLWNGETGVWLLDGEGVRFQPVRAGRQDLQGRVRIEEGLTGGEAIVVYSEKALQPHSRVRVREQAVRP